MDNYLDEELEAIDSLKNGGVILCPTDTLWGLCCDAMDHNAVAKIYEIKDETVDKSLILLVDNIDRLKKYIVEVHPRIETLIHYHRRPISVVYQANENLPEYLSDENGKVTVRVTKDPVLCNIISMLGQPIVSISANASNTPAPITYDDISHHIISSVDYILHPGKNTSDHPKASMVISFDDEGELIFLRK